MADRNPTHALLDEENNLVALVFPKRMAGVLVRLPRNFWKHPHLWNKATSTFEIDIVAMRAAAWNDVKQIRAERLLLAPTGFGTAQSDVSSMVKIAALARRAAGDPSFSVVFTMADNSEVALDAAQMTAFADEVDDYIAAVHARGRALRAAIEAAGTAKALAKIDTAAGWPD